MDILPSAIKFSCGYLLHAFQVRINELEDDSKNGSEQEKLKRRLIESVGIMSDRYIQPLKEHIGI
jgi:hypothetical protein